VLHQIADMTVKIKQYNRAIQQLTEKEYPETQTLLKVYGVGQLTALTYVLTLGSKECFQRSSVTYRWLAEGRGAVDGGASGAA
jgi:hypothetical protein